MLSFSSESFFCVHGHIYNNNITFSKRLQLQVKLFSKDFNLQMTTVDKAFLSLRASVAHLDIKHMENLKKIRRKLYAKRDLMASNLVE